MVPRESSLGLRERCLRGPFDISPTGSGRCPRGSSVNTPGTPSIILTFLGRPGWEAWYEDEEEGGYFPLVRQLFEETLVAAVDTLRTLELLYRVNAELDMLAFEVVLIELRQLPDATELALEASGRPLRVLLGEIARSERLSSVQRSRWGLRGGMGEREL